MEEFIFEGDIVGPLEESKEDGRIVGDVVLFVSILRWTLKLNTSIIHRRRYIVKNLVRIHILLYRPWRDIYRTRMHSV